MKNAIVKDLGLLKVLFKTKWCFGYSFGFVSNFPFMDWDKCGSVRTRSDLCLRLYHSTYSIPACKVIAKGALHESQESQPHGIGGCFCVGLRTRPGPVQNAGGSVDRQLQDAEL